MRREDREIKDRIEMNEIIRGASFCHLAMSHNDIPYVVPMNFGFHDQCIYLHSANEGLKIDILKNNPQVCIEIVQYAQLVKSSDACKYSMKYRSVLIYGKAEFLSDRFEKKNAFGFIVKHYDKNIKADEVKYSSAILDKLMIIKVRIEQMTGKKSI